MTKTLKELFLRVNSMPFKEQKNEFKQAFHNWKGDRKQIDDVLIIGIKLED